MEVSKKDLAEERRDADFLALTHNPSSYRELSLAKFQGHHMNAKRKQQTATNPFSGELCYWYCSVNLLNCYNYDRAIIIYCDLPSSDWQVNPFTKFQRAAFYIF